MSTKGIFILFIFFICCTSKKNIPDNILSVNKMTAVMWDILQADAYASYTAARDSSKKIKEISLNLYSKVFMLHATNARDFENSYAYYKKNPLQGKILIDSLQQYSNRMREKQYIDKKKIL